MGEGSVQRGPRSTAALIVLAIGAAVLFAGFMALGVWQVKRLSWKVDLMARVDQRVHASPVEAPGPAQWPQVNAQADEYRHVRASGTLLHDRETLVQASTELGPGFWVLTPLRRVDGTVVLVNRGFVPPDHRDRATRTANEPQGLITVKGLLRVTEPGGGFLRQNDPVGQRWYSRDVQAIGAAQGLSRVAPYFVDAEAELGQVENWPVGGLTVIAFKNNHLVYAITWFALALMVLGGAWIVARAECRLMRR